MAETNKVENIQVGGQTYAITDSSKVSLAGDTMTGTLTMGTTTTPAYIQVYDGSSTMRNVPTAIFNNGSTSSDVQCVTYTLNNGTLTINIKTK